jgi:hypothetical protein
MGLGFAFLVVALLDVLLFAGKIGIGLGTR